MEVIDVEALEPPSMPEGSARDATRTAQTTAVVRLRNRRPTNKSKGAKQETDTSNASGIMSGSTSEIPAKGMQDRDVAPSSVQVVNAESAPKRAKSTTWARGVLSASNDADSTRSSGPVKLSAVVINAIDRQMKLDFPALPRPPTVEFHDMLRNIFNSGLTLGDGLQLADECRQRGEAWPACSVRHSGGTST